MAVKYGNTWWGQQWLNSLTQIDYSNRLPRGRSYANAGKVNSIEVKGCNITARVQGSRPKPYKVSVSTPPLSSLEKDKLIKAISNKPLVLAQLLNRELPQELLSIAASEGIRLFPSSWRDLNMECSCPDWAVPCKHLASVIYIIANEIDRNPFLVFSLHGLDLISMLRLAGTDVTEHEKESILSIEGIISNKNILEEQALAAVLDYSRIPNLSDQILKLLSQSPLFYPTDFKSVFDKASKLLSKEAAFISKFTPNSEIEIKRGTEVAIYLDSELNIISIDAGDDVKTKDINQLFRAIADIAKNNAFEQHTENIKNLWDILTFTLTICSNRATIPQLLKTNQNSYRIRWIPALLHPKILEQFSLLQQQLEGSNIVNIADSKSDPKPLSPSEQINSICSLFATYIFDSISIVKSNSPGRHSVDKVLNLFFSNSLVSFTQHDEVSIPNTIQLWLKRLQLSQGKYLPMLRIEELDVRFAIDLDIEHRGDGISRIYKIKDFLEDKQFEGDKYQVLKELAMLSEYFPDIKNLINFGRPVEFSPMEFSKVLTEILPVLQMLGISIALPKGLKELVRPTLGIKVTTNSNSSSGKSHLSITDMLSYEWGVSIGDTTITPDEFFALVSKHQGIVKYKEQYLLLNSTDLAAIQKRLLKPSQLSPSELLKAALSGEHVDAKVAISEQINTLITSQLKPEKLDIPSSINATLRPYQVSGYQWLVKNSKLGFGSLIADDMGLGKTLQVIAALQQFKDMGLINLSQKALVIAPTTLLTNWQKEVQKFAPNLITAIYHGTQRSLPEAPYDLLLTSYGLARNDTKTFEKQKWFALIIDEAQNIKNPNTEQTKAVKKIKADVRIAMTGTPVENRLSDYWSVFDFTNKGYLGSLKSFQENFANPIQKMHDQAKAEVFRRATRPFLIRRVKTDKSIISDLPEKLESNLYCNLTPSQASIYQNVVDSIMLEIENNEGIARRGLVLKLITALKQVCNHPVHYLKKGEPSIDLSGKSQMLLSILENVVNSGEKILIFTQYKEMGDLLSGMLQQALGISPLFLHGGVSRKQRDQMVEDFNTKSHHNIFILSLKAGGTGLNLTSASNVLHYDLWWNPAVESQATDRAFRIGQTKNVMVYRMVCKGTFEERIDDMIKSKRKLANLTVENGENWIGDLTNSELHQLVKLSNGN